MVVLRVLGHRVHPGGARLPEATCLVVQVGRWGGGEVFPCSRVWRILGEERENLGRAFGPYGVLGPVSWENPGRDAGESWERRPQNPLSRPLSAASSAHPSPTSPTAWQGRDGRAPGPHVWRTPGHPTSAGPSAPPRAPRAWAGTRRRRATSWGPVRRRAGRYDSCRPLPARLSSPDHLTGDHLGQRRRDGVADLPIDRRLRPLPRPVGWEVL